MRNLTDNVAALEQWLQDFLKDSTELEGSTRSSGQLELIAASHDSPHMIPPERLAYLRKLVRALLNGRVVTAYYNYVLLGLLAIFTILHILERRRYRRRWQVRTARAVTGNSGDGVSSRANSDPSSSRASSSTSSSPCITTPSGALKDSGIDIERLPLLNISRTNNNSSSKSLPTRINAQLAAWLGYQPQPLPFINRSLPSNATSCFVILWLTINLGFHFYQLPLGLDYAKVFAARAGDIFIINLPLLYLLAAKNQPLKLLTGRSYEALNIFHRRVGEWMCLEAFIHSAGEALWRFAFAPDWLSIRPDVWQYLTHRIIYLGIGAFISYELLYFTSLGSFRRRWYEAFLACHVVLQILALGFLYLHYHTARPYVKLSLLIFLVDRLVWRLWMKSTTVEANLRVLPDGDTIVLSATWKSVPRPSRWSFRPRRNIRYGWNPTDHVFVSIPALGRKHTLQAHPFTIASAAPSNGSSVETASSPENPTQAECMKLSLIIRAQEGFTSDLLCYALRHRKVSARLDGPYGSTHALEMLQAVENAVLVAGGSGIAVTLPLVWALLQDKTQRPGGRCRAVRLLWVIHYEEHRHWVSEDELEELLALGLELVIPRPTSEAGRPDVVGQIEDWIEDGIDHDKDTEGQTAVVVSGPDGLNRTVRNTCADAIYRGWDVRLAVEKFGW